MTSVAAPQQIEFEAEIKEQENLDQESKILMAGEILTNTSAPLKERFKALFLLRNLGGLCAINFISSCFNDKSALLKHELAYCLGQMRDRRAVKILEEVLQDENQQIIVRHEAAEALAAIGSVSSVGIIANFSEHEVQELRETCQLALKRISWLHDSEFQKEKLSKNPYNSVDPAPPFQENVDKDFFRRAYLSPGDLWNRYRALFSLRNIGDDDCIKTINEGLSFIDSALFRHEVAYVLGQIQSPLSIDALEARLREESESPMVRHECAEALGSIGNERCIRILREFRDHSEPLIRESCEVALDMADDECNNNDKAS